ncbi:PPPDE peptidase, putative [Hepatocystis sp. ex Piliocolobus tephrosceles]|nr:PPPDE peptidase, putative [Hepatocystis sp. ex Piliocolobus tephrosceles]
MYIWLHTYTLDVPFFLRSVRHTGLEVFGKEYTFSMDGVTTCKPKKSKIGKYCKSYALTNAKITYFEFFQILDALKKIYRPNEYNFIYKNCNHFCDDLFELLSGKRLLYTFMIYSKICKMVMDFKNTATCGYINTMRLSKNDKMLYICALKLSKSIIGKKYINNNITNKNHLPIDKSNTKTSDEFNITKLCTLPYTTPKYKFCIMDTTDYNHILNDSIKYLESIDIKNYYNENKYRVMSSLSTRGSYSLA